MRTHDVVQGSPEWLDLKRDFHGASEAAAMLGMSSKTTRGELLRAKATLSPREFSDWVRTNILDYGHEVEALARPIIENELFDDLYPIVVSNEDEGGNLMASCDGLTLDGSLAFEHKQYSRELFESLAHEGLPEEYMPQCQQVLMLTGASRLIFVCSDGTAENMASIWVEPEPEWFERIVAGWAQFDKDLAAYEVPSVEPELVAEPTVGLPSVVVQVSGNLAVRENLEVFEAALRAFLDRQLIREPNTDQDFADLDGQIKTLKKAEEALKAADAAMLAQVSSVDDTKRRMDALNAMVRSHRLMAEKLLDSEKKRRRDERVLDARRAWEIHVRELQEEIVGIKMNISSPDFAGAIKGLKTLTSISERLDAALANAKIEADRQAADLRAKLTWLDSEVGNYRYLLADLQALSLKPMDDFKLSVLARVDDQKRAEAERRAEEEARQEAAVKAAEERARAEERERQAQEEAGVRAAQEAKERAEREALEKAERERLEAVRLATEAERRAEAAAMAERERAKVAAMAEEAEARRRAADRKHREMINADVVASLVASIEISEAKAKEIVLAVSGGKIDHMKINY